MVFAALERSTNFPVELTAAGESSKSRQKDEEDGQGHDDHDADDELQLLILP
jgi:hypothetical protein